MAAPTSSSSSSFPSPTLLRHPLSSPTTRPPADDLANTWILEFILRQPVPDSLVNEIFISLPFSSSDIHPHLRKTLLLRRISSDHRRRSLSERTLHSLELIMELDRHRGTMPSHRLKAAYCAAAVECTATAFLRSGRDFVDAVERIWMAESAEGLVSEPFLEWGKKMERCISSGEGGEEILKRDVEDGMRLVRDYLEEALEEMGPSFLEIVAAEFEEKRMDLDAVEDKSGGKGVTEMNSCFEKFDEHGEELEKDGGGISMGTMKDCGVQERSGCMADTCVKDLGVGGVREESDGLGEASTMQGGDFNCVLESGVHSVEVEAENKKRGVNVGGHDMPIHGGYNIHQVDPGEVSKVKDALKKSCFDLTMSVEDPLPEAQAVAAAVLDNISRGHVLLNVTEKQSLMENPVLPVSPVDLVTGVDSSTGDMEKEKCNSSDLKQMEGSLIVKACNDDAEPSKRRVVASRSLFERNPTAHTSEWSDDSVESSVPLEKQKSPNLMVRRISRHKGNLVKRRVVKRWTPREEHTLKEAVAKYGKGNWKLILNCHSEIFEERTEVDLKDKWRNMSRHLL